MSFRDKMKALADETVAKANSDDVRARATELSTSVRDAAKALAESDVGQKAITVAKDTLGDVLDNLAAGDSVSQATAKSAKRQVDGRAASAGDRASVPTDSDADAPTE